MDRDFVLVEANAEDTDIDLEVFERRLLDMRLQISIPTSQTARRWQL